MSEREKSETERETEIRREKESVYEMRIYKKEKSFGMELYLIFYRNCNKKEN